VVDLNASNNVPVRTYVWGLDLSESMDGAGGVGGLLWVTLHTPSGPAAGTHFAAYDGNGNIVALSAASDGSGAARYEYGPFGEPLRVTGPAAALNPFRFSTKRTEPTTDLVLYEYRTYNPIIGRWLSRDPIGEPGQTLIVNSNRRMSRRSRPAELYQGPNLFAYVANNPNSWVDPDGRALWGPSFSPQSVPNPSSALQDVDYPWYVDVFGAVCDVGSVVSICFDIATIPSGEGAVATVCLQACKQNLKRRIKEKIACDALYRRIHGNPPGTGACDKPQSCQKDGVPIKGMPVGWYLERAANALECSALRTAWLKKCACKGLKNKKWHGKDWETHWREAGIAAANFTICIYMAKEAGWEGDVPSIPQ
jgi:RHS repeat-associated protein